MSRIISSVLEQRFCGKLLGLVWLLVTLGVHSIGGDDNEQKGGYDIKKAWMIVQAILLCYEQLFE